MCIKGKLVLGHEEALALIASSGLPGISPDGRRILEEADARGLTGKERIRYVIREAGKLEGNGDG